MAKDTEEKKHWNRPVKVHTGGGAIYGLGIIGAAIYYLQHATTFWIGVIGIIKSIFWPAVLIYQVFTMLKL